MQIDDLKKLPINDDELYFDYDLKKLNWFNIGGKTKVFFKAKSLTGLVNFLKTSSN
jgi:UDP-N-acetylmuramate dehydrogenase